MDKEQEKVRELVIEVINLNKSFLSSKNSDLSISKRLFGLFENRKKSLNLYKALQNINFSIRRGEVFGIIGRNGSGKSTLLLLLLGAMIGDKGSIIRRKGKMLRLALGMGMDGNLSARDNIYINGSMLGLSFKQIGEKFSNIARFADVEDSIDMPIKHFSKGMRARLNFAIALHVNADILLLDEFFGGVGDRDFRAKSNNAFKKKLIRKKTVIIVSHNMSIMKDHCNRVMWLDKGVVKEVGAPKKVIRNYKRSFKGKTQDVQ